MEEDFSTPESLGDELDAFYIEMFGRVWSESEVAAGYAIFDTDVTQTQTKIHDYNQRHKQEVEVLVVEIGSRIAWPFLTACDWEKNFFVVSQPLNGQLL